MVESQWSSVQLDLDSRCFRMSDMVPIYIKIRCLGWDSQFDPSDAHFQSGLDSKEREGC